MHRDCALGVEVQYGQPAAMGRIGLGELLVMLLPLALLCGGIGAVVLVVVLAGKGARCSACRRRVAKRAATCPHCGAPLPSISVPT